MVRTPVDQRVGWFPIAVAMAADGAIHLELLKTLTQLTTTLQNLSKGGARVCHVIPLKAGKSNKACRLYRKTLDMA